MTRNLSFTGKCFAAVLITAIGLSLYGCSDSSSVSTTTAPTAFTITSGSPLPTGFVGITYPPLQLATINAVGAVTWSLDAGSPPLPGGLNLSSGGLLSGQPTGTTNGQVLLKIRAQDSSQPAAQVTVKEMGVTVSQVPQPSITTASLPNGVQNVAYSVTLNATGGTPPYTTWSVTPPLPTGLVLTPGGATATISGTPTVTSNQTHTFSVTDSFSPTPQTGTRQLTLTITAAPLPLNITTNSLQPGTQLQPYNDALTASGGTVPLTWSVVSSANPNLSLPPGLQLNQNTGAITGTPTTFGTFSPTFRVTDLGSPQQSNQTQLTIVINQPTALTITTGSLPNGVLNQPYNATVQANGGSGTRNWSFQGGTIPSLTINSSTGEITGNPTPTGNFTFTVKVTDALFTATKDFTVSITAPSPSITTLSLPIGTVGVPYSAQVQATGSALPLNFQPMGLPFGLTFNVTLNSSTATITGIPTSNGSQDVTFTVNDSAAPFNNTGTKTLPLTVNAALTISAPSSLPSGCTHTSYGPVTFQASGGTPPYIWTTTATPPLPAGLTITPAPSPSATATLSGTPTAADNQSHTFTVKDSTANPAATKSLPLAINGTLTITTNSPLPSGQQNIAYAPVTLTACGGTPPYTWSTAVTPPLPSGMSINSAGVISGTPTVQENNISHTFTVQDATANPPATKALNLTIAP